MAMADLITPAAELADESPSIADLVAAAAIRQPEATALVATPDRTPVSYGELVRLVGDLAKKLKDGGLRPGDRIALRSGSNAEFVVGLLAASRAGLIAVPLDPALPVGDQRARSEVAGAGVVLVDGEGSGDQQEPDLVWWTVAVTIGRDGAPSSVTLDAPAPPNPDVTTPDGLRDDDAMIMFTGGTTGMPKMVPWTHTNIASSVRGIIAAYQLGPADATVAVMPLYHGHGLVAALLSTLASGGTVLLPARGKFSAHTFWDDIHAVGATWYTAVPTIHQILLERAQTGRPDGGRVGLHFIRSCSAPLTPETAQALQDTFGATVVCAFGMTEGTHQVATTAIDQIESPSDTTGLVGRSTGPQIRIVAPDGQTLAPEAVGEVWLRGPTVVRGYLGDPTITAANFTDGWLRTGDLGSLSSAGDLSIRGRIKELINRGGEKISPERVEGVLASHPDVLEVAVLGLPDKMYGETVAAVVVGRGSTPPSQEELTEFCRGRLAPYEVPATILAASELPHTAKGSLDRRAVANQFGGS